MSNILINACVIFVCVLIALLKSFTQNRNERMMKADAFSARRNIYYDQDRGETMICSDTDEEVENTEVKRDFSWGEDRFLW